MSAAKPTIGRAVLYTLTENDAASFRTPGRPGNPPRPGEEYPATVVRVWGDGAGPAVNLRVHLDGTDDLWAPSRTEGVEPGTWRWPPRSD